MWAFQELGLVFLAGTVAEAKPEMSRRISESLNLQLGLPRCRGHQGTDGRRVRVHPGSTRGQGLLFPSTGGGPSGGVLPEPPEGCERAALLYPLLWWCSPRARAGVVSRQLRPLCSRHPWPWEELTMVGSFSKQRLGLPGVPLRAKLWGPGTRKSPQTLREDRELSQRECTLCSPSVTGSCRP